MRRLLLLFLLIPVSYARDVQPSKLETAKSKIEELENIGELCTRAIDRHKTAIAELEKTVEEVKLEIRKIAKENNIAGYEQ